MTLRRRTIACAIAASALIHGAASAQPAPGAADPEAQKQADARAHFNRGVALSETHLYDAALAEFQRSRELYPNRTATKNAALCLLTLKRFDEALDMFEELQRFPNLALDDAALADGEVRHLSGLVGSVELRGAEAGAMIVIDGRNRGGTPVAAPLRVSAGTHVVRVYKEGFQPFEERVDVAGAQSKSVQVTLVALAQAGRLKVTEQGGRALEVVVDNVSVGKTPWEGPLAEGDHTVLLRGEGDVGTQPASVPVHTGQVTPVTLAAEDLSATLRVQPTPAGASVAIDGVSVGRGLWEGRLRPGDHKVEVASEGFLPQPRSVSIGTGKREVVAVELDRDPASPMWGDSRGHFLVEIDGAFGLMPTFGDDIAGGCTAPCSASLVIGGMAVAHPAWRFASGFMLGVDLGYLYLRQSTTGRKATIMSGGLTPDSGSEDDTLTRSGVLVGASAGFHVGSSFPLTFRLGVGAFHGSLLDSRTGTFTTSTPPSKQYSIPPTSASPSATSFYIAPEVRLGVRLGQSFEISAGAEALVLIGGQPAWSDDGTIPTAEGLGHFSSDALARSVLIAFMPGLGGRYEF